MLARLFRALFRGIRGRPGLLNALKNSGWLIAARVLRLSVGLFVWAWVARYLGPSQLGVLSYAAALVAILAAVSTLGLNRILVREVVAKPSEKDTLVGITLILRLAAGCMLVPLAYGVSTLSGPVDPRIPIVVLIISAGLIFQAFDAIDLWFQAKVRSVYAVIARSVAFLLLSATKVLLITYHAPLEAFAWTALAETMLAAIGLAIAYQISGNQLRRWRFQWRSAMALLRESSPEIFAALGAIMFMRMDQIMLGHMLGPDAVGLYSAAVAISEVWYFIPIAIVASTYPGIIKAKSQSEELYYQQLHRLFVGLALLSIGIAVIVSLLSDWIVYALYGATYSGAATVLAIHSWTLMAVSFGLVSGSWIFTEKKAILNLYRTALGAVANVILNLLLIPRFGLAGAAVATLASQLLAYYVFDMFTPSMKHIFALKTRAAILVDARDVITSMLQR